MVEFLKKELVGNKFELLIDTEIFSKDIILKASYNFLNLGYFFFKYDEKKNMILQFTSKADVNQKPEEIISLFTDELLNVTLRDTLEKENRVVREAIINAAIGNAVDFKNYVSIDTDMIDCGCDEVDFDKDIDQILKEIENDPDLKIDEDEIERILKEIEEESKIEMETMESSKQNKDTNIDEILKGLENDPDLKVDEEEMAKILKEIEDESKAELEDSKLSKPKIVLDPKNVKDAKKRLSSGK